MNILIIEDSPTTASLLKNMFESDGYSVVTADSGINGIIRLALANPPVDAVLLDLQLPDMTGAKWLYLVRKEDTWKDTRVVVLTASDAVEIEAFSREFPDVKVFRKPTPLENLKALVRLVLHPEKT